MIHLIRYDMIMMVSCHVMMYSTVQTSGAHYPQDRRHRQTPDDFLL